MAKRKRSTHRTVTSLVVDQAIAIPAVEETQTSTILRANLAEINKCKGVIGYILRNTTSATIDLKDTAKLVDYAILSSQALDSGKEILELFDMGEVKNILIKGKDIKVLCLIIDENTISVFMEKDTDHADILRQLSS